MEDSNLHLSQAELHLFCNPDVILTKNTILKKTVLLLQDLQNRIKPESIENDIFSTSPKISKGENYLGLPYVILDYPRKTNQHNICFIRNMFWWGNFFSSTLHISGSYKEQFTNNILNSYDDLIEKKYFVGVNDNPWIHHFEVNNYVSVDELKKEDFKKIILEKDTLKIAAKWPLIEWSTALESLNNSWKFLKGLIS